MAMSDWLTTAGNDWGALAKLIIVTELPYEVGDKPDHFKRDSQVDNRPKYWPYPPADTMAWIERSFRFPIEILDDTLDEDGDKSPMLEWVVAGFGVGDENVSIPVTPFDHPDPQKTLDRFGRVLINRCVRKTGYKLARKSSAGPPVVESRLSNVPTDWEFRGRMIRLEKILRIKYALAKQPSDMSGVAAYLYVGYEGAGAY
jgi:hypothetical protein